MKTSLQKDRTYLEWNNSRGIRWTINRGYQWYMEKYLPAVQRIEKVSNIKDRFLLCDSYLMIGDIYDFIECPKAAIKAYKKSYKFCKQNSDPLIELGTMHERIGQYSKAAYYLKKSLKIEPENERAIHEYKSVQYSLDDPGCLLYEETDVCWQAREAIARSQPKAALRLLKNKRTIQALQIKACAYAVLEGQANYLDQWQKIEKAKGMIEMYYADWFYIEDRLLKKSAIWEIFLNCAKQNRFKTWDHWPMWNSLYESIIKHPQTFSLRFSKSKAAVSRHNKRIVLQTQYEIARTNKDLNLAKKLSARYPQWPEINKLKDRLSRK